VNPFLTITSIIITSILATAIFSLFAYNNNNVYAQSISIQNVTIGNSTLYVMGNAQTMVKPDKVALSLTVEMTNKTANEALNANSEVINDVLDALEA
jgi:uncharacterized protein YggE